MIENQKHLHLPKAVRRIARTLNRDAQRCKDPQEYHEA